MKIGPDALKWSWLLVLFGLALLADGYFNLGMLTSTKKQFGERSIRYGSFGRGVRIVFGIFFTVLGAGCLLYLATL